MILKLQGTWVIFQSRFLSTAYKALRGLVLPASSSSARTILQPHWSFVQYLAFEVRHPDKGLLHMLLSLLRPLLLSVFTK